MRALIIVDVQNDFCEGGSLAVAGGTAVAEAVTQVLVDRPRLWDHIVATKDYHIDPGAHFSDTPDFVDSWPPHTVVGTPGSDFHPALETEDVEAVFTKGAHEAAYSGFQGKAGSINLAAWLRMHDVTEVDLVGIATDHCVRATALDAVREGFAATVLLDLTAGVAQSTVDAGLTQLREAGVELVGEPHVG